jgi:hypothetical protein
VFDAEAHYVAGLVLVEPAFDRGDQGNRQAGLGAVVQRLLLASPQVLPADREVGTLVDGTCSGCSPWPPEPIPLCTR